MAFAIKTRNTASRLLAAAAVLSGLVLSAAPAHAATPPPHPGASAATATTLPVVNMEATVLAAQIDPRRADNTLTPGAHDSVLAVEQALEARHLLDARWVDGYFGTTTITAYAAFQRSLGYTGLAANGLPGASSLAVLGQGRFTVTYRIGPGAKLQRDGYTINTRTQSMLTEAERLLGFHLTLSQGSYNPGGDPTSAGTHDGGGVVDVNIDGMSSTTRTAVARALREVGFAAWVRNPSQGDWPWHIHAAAINDTDLSTQAQNQIGDYYLGLNGLANRGADDGPRIPIQTWEEYQRTH
ncbi:peptidoglycan hydrolase-like protein with peptidoglycan-binding domain [Kitasatospora sp. MAA4]|uniref:peptidoglycan-binding protein n=1 Tax=Kitasatospora sp. MAA4 TaxID=3035093 RepID=UPI0024763514|nr:peptidoglycan-binding protein [Kitasatospora sp. MAA4]MDH6130936.1 peptidoglycan hydrolase-like protein with peptidoglycan-binding domain [Kitasatospora sp. MAA4]